MKCNKCKTELIEEAKYCHECGNIILRKVSFIANGKTRKRELNILVDEIKKLRKETKELKDRIKLLEERSIIPNTITYPSLQQEDSSGTITWPGTITSPNANEPIFYTGTGFTDESDNTTTFGNSSANFTINSNSSNLVISTEGSIGI